MEEIGIIDGRKIYVDTGVDTVKVIRQAIKERVNAKKLKAGDGFYMPVEFDERLVVKVTVEVAP